MVIIFVSKSSHYIYEGIVIVYPIFLSIICAKKGQFKLFYVLRFLVVNILSKTASADVDSWAKYDAYFSAPWQKYAIAIAMNSL